MPEDNATTPSIPPVDTSVTSAAPAEPVSEPAPAPEPTPEPVVPESTPKESSTAPIAKGIPAIYSEVAAKIRDSQNVLIALSSDPSVDDMATAIGLSLYLDKLGKRATAIYSGTTPNALEFLKPEDTFESTADTLQDFVIAINKEKADHLRYKLDGDYVKIYITPYKARISEEDLDFSYGDFNVDLVIALNVANGIDLDSALREHGRIMHDASIINVTTGNPGKFGEIEWSDKSASSVSEMIARLLYSANESNKIDKEEATAFLTGIVAATNRFSNASTTPETMQIASQLMESGANQQLVSKNITPDVENQLLSINKESSPKKEEAPESTPKSESKSESNSGLALEADDPTNLNISHRQTDDTEPPKEATPAPAPTPAPAEKEDNLLDDLKAAEESLSHTGAETTPENKRASLQIDSEHKSSNLDEITNGPSPVSQTEPQSIPQSATEPNVTTGNSEEKTIKPSNDFGSSNDELENEQKYGKMLEDALDAVSSTPVLPEQPIMSSETTGVAPEQGIAPSEPSSNPAAASAPAVPMNPEINGVPEMNYMPLPDQEILPPPPAPPIDLSNMAPGSLPETMPPAEAPAPVSPTEPAPTPEQASAPEDPAAFKIPGM